MINGHGLYYYDTVSTVAQMQANDLITLLVGLPLLVVSAWLAGHSSLRGRLLLTGVPDSVAIVIPFVPNPDSAQSGDGRAVA